MGFKVQSEPFRTGQFVAMWTYNGVMWCDAYKVTEQGTCMYNSETDEYTLSSVTCNYKELGTAFIQYKEGSS